MDKLAELQKLVESAQGHGDKLYNHNTKKYGTELRKDLMAIVKLCQEQRKAVLEFQKAMPPKVKKAGDAKEEEEEVEEEAEEEAEEEVEVEETKPTKKGAAGKKEVAKAEPAKETKEAKPAAKAPAKKK